MNLSSLIPSPYRWLVLAVLGAALLAFGALQGARWQENVDAVQIARLQAAGDQERARLAAAALARASANAAETARRIAAMEENQRDQDRLLARMRRDRDDAFAAADRLREQSAAAAREWGARLADSPTAGDVEAAAGAIELLVNVRSRLERAGAELAAHTDAARAAGSKCVADYEALRKPH